MTPTTGRALWLAAAVIIVTVAVTCTALCLLLRSAWWGKAIDCAGFTLLALYAWRLCWHAEAKR